MEGKKGKLGRRDLLAGVAALGAVGPRDAEAAKSAPGQPIDRSMKSASEGVRIDTAAEHLFQQRPDIFRFDSKVGRLTVWDNTLNMVVYNKAFDTQNDVFTRMYVADDGTLVIRTTLRSKAVSVAIIRLNKRGGVTVEFHNIVPPSIEP